MKQKTSLTLSREVLKGIDRIAGKKYSRSAVVENVLAEYLRTKARAHIEARDLDALNRAADELAPEIEEVVRYQAEMDEPL
jgi:hypothetical protein